MKKKSDTTPFTPAVFGSFDKLSNRQAEVVIYQIIRKPNEGLVFTYISKNVEHILGTGADVFLDNPGLFVSYIQPEYIPLLREAEESSFKNLSTFQFEGEFKTAQGKSRWIHLFSTPFKLPDESVVWNGTLTDLTEQKQTDLKIIKYNHELTLLNVVNDCILYIQDEHELLSNVCRLLVEEGNYRLVWIGFEPPESDGNRKVEAYTSCGETGYVKEIVIDLNDPELSKGPTATALIKGQTIITNDLEVAEHFKPWLQKAKKFGMSSSIGIPLTIGTSQRAVINIYSSWINAFDEHEVLILERIARNISFALTNIRIRKEKEITHHQLTERNKELSVIYEASRILDKGLSIEETIETLTQLLPKAWQYPESCVAKISFGSFERCTKPEFNAVDFQETKASTQEGKILNIQVGYTEQKPIEAEGPFLKEERELIDMMSEMLINYLDKRAQNEALLKSKANLKTIFDHTEVGYLLMDNEYRIISYNQPMYVGYAQHTGIKLEVGDLFTEALLADRKARLVNMFEQVMLSQKPVEYETTYNDSEGTFYYTITLVPVVSNKNSIGLCLSAYNITKRKLMELEREAITSDLMQRNRDLEQFAYMVSHNLRAPLTNIMALTNLLNSSITDDDKAIAIQSLNESSYKLDEVIQDMVQILQVRRGVSEVKQLLSLHELIDGVKNSMKRALQETHAIIDTDFTACEAIFAVPSYATSIFYNLIANAIQYTKSGNIPRIQLKSEGSDGYTKVHIQDNGLGIDMERYGTQVFGLYKRFHPQFDGKGVGLFMVKTQMEAMGGTISIKSTPGEGTLFILTFKTKSGD